MKKEYTNPEIIISKFNVENIVTTSGDMTTAVTMIKNRMNGVEDGNVVIWDFNK